MLRTTRLGARPASVPPPPIPDPPLTTPDSRDPRPVLDLKAAAALLGIRADTLRQQALAGKLRTALVGRRRFTSHAWLADYRASHFLQQGRPAEITARDSYLHRFKALQTWERSRKAEVVTRLAVEAGVYAVCRHPGAEREEMTVILRKHRVTILHREPAAARARAVEAILDQIYAEATTHAERYQAHKAASRARKSPLGARWAAEFSARRRVDDTVTPEHVGALARIELEVATALARHLLAEDPGMTFINCRERLLQAMLEGSPNLPDDPWVCLQIREATVDKAVRRAVQEGARPPQGPAHG